MSNIAIVKAYSSSKPHDLFAVVPVYVDDVTLSEDALIDCAKDQLRHRLSPGDLATSLFKVERRYDVSGAPGGDTIALPAPSEEPLLPPSTGTDGDAPALHDGNRRLTEVERKDF